MTLLVLAVADLMTSGLLLHFRKSHHISGYQKQVNVTPPVCEG